MDKKIRSSFENLSPGEEQKNRMWDEIVKKTEKTGKKSYKMPKMLRLTATFALVAIMLLSIGTMTNAATNGRVMEVIRQVLGIEQLSQSVSGQAQQISEKGTDGKKHVIEKSMFSRGNKIIVIGVRDGDSFRAKKYSRTPYHLVEQIVEVHEDGTMITRSRQDQ